MSSVFVQRADAVQRAVAGRVLTSYKRKGRLFNRTVGGDLVSVVEFRMGR